jgi:hypothetical protein
MHVALNEQSNWLSAEQDADKSHSNIARVDWPSCCVHVVVACVTLYVLTDCCICVVVGQRRPSAPWCSIFSPPSFQHMHTHIANTQKCQHCLVMGTHALPCKRLLPCVHKCMHCM